jgi:hypothetical protein
MVELPFAYFIEVFVEPPDESTAQAPTQVQSRSVRELSVESSLLPQDETIVESANAEIEANMSLFMRPPGNVGS